MRIQLGQGSATTVAKGMLKNEGMGAFYKVSHDGFILFESRLFYEAKTSLKLCEVCSTLYILAFEILLVNTFFLLTFFLLTFFRASI